MAGTILFCLQWCTSSKLSIVVHLLKRLNYFRLPAQRKGAIMSQSKDLLSLGACPVGVLRHPQGSEAALWPCWRTSDTFSTQSAVSAVTVANCDSLSGKCTHRLSHLNTWSPGSGLSWSLAGESRSLEGRGRALVFMAHQLPIPSDFCSTNCKEGNFCLSPIQKLGIPSLWLRETYPSSKKWILKAETHTLDTESFK